MGKQVTNWEDLGLELPKGISEDKLSKRFQLCVENKTTGLLERTDLDNHQGPRSLFAVVESRSENGVVKSSLSLVPSYRQNIIALLEIRWDWYNTTHCKEGLQKHTVKYLTSDDYHYEAILLTFKEVIETLKDNAWEDVIDDIIYESIIDCKQPLKWAKH